MSDALPTIALLVTSHNRRELTVASLLAAKQAARGVARLTIHLADASSTDGTVEEVKSALPDADVIQVSADTYWNRGMAAAWVNAAKERPDFYLWLNDDLELFPNALRELLNTYRAQRNPRTLIVGKTIDPTSNEVTYGGYRRASRISRIRWRRLRSDEVECHTMNGNCVLIPGTAFNDVGINCNHYQHAFGDIDYGLAAGRRGYQIIELKAPVGEQERNSGFIYNGQKVPLTLANIEKVLCHPKGIPVSDWLYFCLRNAGPLWPANFLIRYVNVFFR